MQPFPHRERAPKLASAWLALAVALTACAPFNMPGNAPAEALPTAVESPALAKTATPNQAGPTQAAYPAAAQPSAYPASQATTEPSAIATAGEPTQSADDRVAQLPDPGGFTWQPLVSGLERVTAVVDAGEGRMLALEQVGRVRTIRNGQREATPFLDISDRVGSQGNEQGLLGIALHPDYATNRYFYVNYTNPNGATTIARFQASVDGSQADPASEKVLLTADQPYQNHNGGAMVFGPDGYLYLGLGDGGSAGDPQGNGQNPNTLLGAILRIDVDHADPYAIPADNPFADGQTGRAEIWAYGLRNPWRFSFDRATGDLYVADVGQNQWEEIDFLPAGTPGGVNFGWNYREGAHPYNSQPPAGLALVDPVAEYAHPEGCSVTGGYVYRGAVLPEFNGVYLYGDYCTGRVWGLLRQADGNWQNRLLFETGAFITSFAEDRSGELYLLDQRAGALLELVRKAQ